MVIKMFVLTEIIISIDCPDSRKVAAAYTAAPQSCSGIVRSQTWNVPRAAVNFPK